MYGDAGDYQVLLVYLLDGLKKCGSRVIFHSKVNVTLVARFKSVLENMRKNNVCLVVENIVALFETLLFVHDYQTSMFVVRLLRQGEN